MNILFIGNGLSLAQRAAGEGHTVHLQGRVGKSIVDKPQYNQPLTTGTGRLIKSSVNMLLKETSPGLVVFTGNGMGDMAEHVCTQRVPVLGGGKWGDVCNGDEEYGRHIMKIVGVPHGAGSGVQVACSMWWNGLTASLHMLTINNSRLMEGDIGKDIGSAGSTVMFVQPGKRIMLESVSKVERLLKKVNYRGPITLRCVVSEQGVSGVGWKVGFAYDSTQAMFELYKGSMAELLYNMASGAGVSGKCYFGMGIGVRVSIPPYPHGAQGVVGVPLTGVSEENSKHVWLRDAQAGSEGYVSSGVDGNVLTITARGKDVRECRRRAYRTISNLDIADMQYRRDIGESVESDLLLLRKWGYL